VEKKKKNRGEERKKKEEKRPWPRPLTRSCSERGKKSEGGEKRKGRKGGGGMGSPHRDVPHSKGNRKNKNRKGKKRVTSASKCQLGRKKKKKDESAREQGDVLHGHAEKEKEKRKPSAGTPEIKERNKKVERKTRSDYILFPFPSPPRRKERAC